MIYLSRLSYDWFYHCHASLSGDPPQKTNEIARITSGIQVFRKDLSADILIYSVNPRDALQTPCLMTNLLLKGTASDGADKQTHRQSVCLWFCGSVPLGAVFLKASHWP